MEKILITDGRSLASLAIARSLGKKGFEVHCGEEFKTNLTFFSRYVKKRIVYSSPEKQSEQFLDELLKLVKKERYNMIIPVRDAITLLLAKYKDEILKYTNLYLADYETIKKFRDKGETVKLAMKCNIPCPETYYPEEMNIKEIKNHIVYPVLIRSRISSGARGISYVNSSDKFDEAYYLIKKDYGEPMIQEYVSKKKYCTACILLDGASNEIATFIYERVKEYPISGGPTVVGISCNNTTIKEYAMELLKEAKWVGAAEVEFIIDSDGTPKLLEVNPRFWMPLNLSIKSGVDFPYLLYKLANGEMVEPIKFYKLGVMYRWVLPNEILWLMQTPNKIKGFREFINLREGDTCYGVLSFNDPMPAVGTILQGFNFILNDEKRKFMFKRGW